MTTSIEDNAGATRGESHPRAAFHSMTEGTQADWDRIVAAQLELYPGSPTGS